MAHPKGQTVSNPIVTGSVTDKYGTHYSYLGIGGYQEALTLAERDAIPVDELNGLSGKGLSSGRRSLYMLCPVLEEKKTYRLEVDFDAWVAMTDAQKVAALADNGNWVEFRGGGGSSALLWNPAAGEEGYLKTLPELVEAIAQTQGQVYLLLYNVLDLEGTTLDLFHRVRVIGAYHGLTGTVMNGELDNLHHLENLALSALGLRDSLTGDIRARLVECQVYDSCPIWDNCQIKLYDTQLTLRHLESEVGTRSYTFSAYGSSHLQPSLNYCNALNGSLSILATPSYNGSGNPGPDFTNHLTAYFQYYYAPGLAAGTFSLYGNISEGYAHSLPYQPINNVGRWGAVPPISTGDAIERLHARNYFDANQMDEAYIWGNGKVDLWFNGGRHSVWSFMKVGVNFGFAAYSQRMKAGTSYTVFIQKTIAGDLTIDLPAVDDDSNPVSNYYNQLPATQIVLRHATAGATFELVCKRITLDYTGADPAGEEHYYWTLAGVSFDASQKEDTGVAQGLVNALRLEIVAGAPAAGNTLAKLYNLIIGGASSLEVATIAARNAANVPARTQVLVSDDGDGKWALYYTSAGGVNASYIKLSDPDLLNTVMSAAAIQSAYESNADTNRFTTALKTKLENLYQTAIATDAEMQAGTDNVKAASPLRLSSWWTWLKTQAAIISARWTFSAGLTTSAATFSETVAPGTAAANTINIWAGDEDGRTIYRMIDDKGFITTLLPGLILIFNNTGSTLTSGQAVRVAAPAANGRPQVVLADQSNDLPAIGLVAENIPTGAAGFVRVQGSVNNLNTSAWANGAQLYKGAGGALTDARPTAPNYAQAVAVVLHSHNTAGRLYVEPGPIMNDDRSTNQNQFSIGNGVGTLARILRFLATFTGDITHAVLTAARTWTFPDKSGTVVIDPDPRLSDARTPTGAAAGHLSGTYPNPTIKSDASIEANRPIVADMIRDLNILTRHLALKGVGFPQLRDFNQDTLMGRQAAGAGQAEEVPIVNLFVPSPPSGTPGTDGILIAPGVRGQHADGVDKFWLWFLANQVRQIAYLQGGNNFNLGTITTPGVQVNVDLQYFWDFDCYLNANQGFTIALLNAVIGKTFTITINFTVAGAHVIMLPANSLVAGQVGNNGSITLNASQANVRFDLEYWGTTINGAALEHHWSVKGGFG